MDRLLFSYWHHKQVLASISLAFLCSCANIVPPSGGPKDTTPPKVISSEPAENATNYAGNTIRLTFDEYVQLKDENRNLLVNPPLAEPPELKVKGKSILIKIPGTLKENKTYSFQFGNAIQDFTEGNPLANYSFVFSTGPVIDSLSLNGKVLRADNLEPVGKAIAMLYADKDDSALFKEKPLYVTRTGEDGNFRFNHLASGKYRLFAVNDLNNNFMIDMASEEFAFADSLVSGSVLPVVKPDSACKDSLLPAVSSLSGIILYSYKETDSLQRLQKPYLDKAGQLLIPYRQPLKDLGILPWGKSASLGENWAIREWSANRDTLICWFKPEPESDSLFLILKTDRNLTDTVRVDLKRIGKTGRFRKDGGKTGKIVATPDITGIMDPGKPLSLTFGYPLSAARLSESLLVEEKDTLKVRPVFSDSIHRRIILRHTWKENSSYQFILPKGILTDILGQTNDSLSLKFKTLSLDSYGKLTLKFKASQPGQYILQLIADKDKVVQQTIIQTEGRWVVNYLSPGKYRVKMIADKNNNSHWDGGNYRRNTLPEKVLFYSKTLEIRGNWEVEETWEY
ncbi:MAG: Ig-like domain-containing protein [Bacteroidetes bacterium]|nr:Ig-like domain-containing protein [Bacteroidota bacterium]